MRGFQAFLTVVLVLALAMVTYFFVGGTLSADCSVASAPAADYADAFVSIRSLIASGAAPQMFSNDEITSAQDYLLIDVNISLKNIGLFDAEWLDIEVTPAPGDVAVYSLDGHGSDISAMSRGKTNLKLLTTASADAPRSVTIQYYVLGMPRSIQVAITGAK